MARGISRPPVRPGVDTEWITTGEAARRLGVGSLNTVKRWAREGRLESRHVGARVQIRAQSIARLLAGDEPQVARAQRLHELLAQVEDIGKDLSPNDWERLLAERRGRLPWDLK